MNEASRRRFWAKVEMGPFCWEWRGSLNTGGYGNLTAASRAKLAHRASWEMHFGPIPDGLCVMHRCDNRRCVNPAHLVLGTYLDNNRDGFAKGRMRPRGKVPLTEAQQQEICARWLEGAKAAHLGREFGITPQGIARMVRRRGLTQTKEAR